MHMTRRWRKKSRRTCGTVNEFKRASFLLLNLFQLVLIHCIVHFYNDIVIVAALLHDVINMSLAWVVLILVRLGDSFVYDLCKWEQNELMSYFCSHLLLNMCVCMCLEFPESHRHSHFSSSLMPSGNLHTILRVYLWRISLVAVFSLSLPQARKTSSISNTIGSERRKKYLNGKWMKCKLYVSLRMQQIVHTPEPESIQSIAYFVHYAYRIEYDCIIEMDSIQWN